MNNEKAVFAAYFHKVPDPQRGHGWDNTIKPCEALLESLRKKAIYYVLFHDGINLLKYKSGKTRQYVEVRKPDKYVPNVHRWFIYYEYLLKHPEIEWIWMVDSTDVEMLKNPFERMRPGVLYLGSEQGQIVENKWMQSRQEPYFKAPDYRAIIASQGDKMLINCGLVGGSRDVVMEYLQYVCHYHQRYSISETQSTDMACCNYTVWKHFKSRFDYGVHVNTLFKGYEINNKLAWWKHK